VATQWWDMSGAFALYGIVAGGVISTVTVGLTNKHARKMATDARAFQETEATRSRQHEIDLDRLRSLRSTRERFYPGIAEAAQQIMQVLGEEATAAMAGTQTTKSTDLDLDSPEQRQKWAGIMVFGTDSSIAAWRAFLAAQTALQAGVAELRVALSEQHRAPLLVTPAVGKVDGLRHDLVETTGALLTSMREDLRYWMPATGGS
jgi:hypothetical protein